MLTRLAEHGPEVGIHVVVWADSYATAERALRRPGIGHFGLRAVLRVHSPTESDALLGVPAAASLADDRALFRDTDWPHEQIEKFKPYSISSLYAFAREVPARDRLRYKCMTEQELTAAPAIALSPYLVAAPGGPARHLRAPACWPGTPSSPGSWPPSASTCCSSPGSC